MKNILVVLLILSFISCEKNSSNPVQKDKFFNLSKLSLLVLDSLTDFWYSDSISNKTNYFTNYVGYLGGTYLVKDEKSIGVAVFESKEKAIKCMEDRINSVALKINEGKPNDILNIKWWNSFSFSYYVFANQSNTIIEVGVLYRQPYEIDTLLMKTAAQIAKRIDKLSDEL